MESIGPVIKALDRQLIKQKQATQQLFVSIRQVKHLLRRYRHEGAEALISGRPGRFGLGVLCSMRMKTCKSFIFLYWLKPVE